jgi:tRNA(Arg) A34 adenosine deaminase TadA
MDATRVTEDDKRHLRRAIELARDSAATGNEPFGSLLVRGGTVIAEERNTCDTDRDITAHPELKLARWAGRELSREQARETTMYTSCQPCGMCFEGMRRSGLGRVVYALSAEQLAGLFPDDFGSGPKAAGPALYEEARALFEGT